MFSARTKILFEGLNFAGITNALSRKFTLFDVEHQGKKCQITVQTAVAKQIVAYLEEKCYNVLEVQAMGISCLLHVAKKRVALVCALVFCVAFLAWSATVCWKIEVEGDFERDVVLQSLRQQGIYVGRSLVGLDVDALSNALSVNLDATYAIVRHSGSILQVSAFKRKAPVPIVDVHSSRDIVATCSGMVLQMCCEQGTAVVAVGDSVQKGDLLIRGCRTFSDGTTEPTYALGRIVLQRSHTAFVPYNPIVEVTEDTGKVFVANNVVLFGKTYGKNPPFKSYRQVAKQTKLWPLGLTVWHVSYIETQTVQKHVPLQQCVDNLKQQALQLATQQASFAVTSVQYVVSEKGVEVTVFGETYIN